MYRHDKHSSYYTRETTFEIYIYILLVDNDTESITDLEQ